MVDQALRVIVCGTRDYADETLLEFVLERLFECCHRAGRELVIVTGACPPQAVIRDKGRQLVGADYLAEQCALRAAHRGEAVRVERHPADWSGGLSGGPIRNRKMAVLGATLCLAFWNGVSKGTMDMIGQCVKHKITVFLPAPGSEWLAARLFKELLL